MTVVRDFITSSGSQQVNYINPMFLCFADRSYCSAETDYVMREHWHEEIEYLIVISGVMHCSVNGEKTDLHAGEGIMVNSKRIHANASPKGESCEFFYVVMHPSCLAASPYIEQKYLAPFLAKENCDFILLKKDDWTNEIMEDLLRMMKTEAKNGFELEIIECAYRSFRIIVQHMPPVTNASPVSSVYDASFKAMLSYIRDHYAEKISLDDIANAGSCGKTLCARLFRRFTSETPGQYLIRCRITRGAELLKTTDKSVTDIAYETGFTSPSHFTQVFRQIMGTTPNRYRKESV
ncbi:MAG: hypothetical protein CW338_06290 [Clostridiales bacterium]|nr:hypothetical protein [Clostridiales bacterium]